MAIADGTSQGSYYCHRLAEPGIGTAQDYRYKETHVLGKAKEGSGKQKGR